MKVLMIKIGESASRPIPLEIYSPNHREGNIDRDSTAYVRK